MGFTIPFSVALFTGNKLFEHTAVMSDSKVELYRKVKETGSLNQGLHSLTSHKNKCRNM